MDKEAAIILAKKYVKTIPSKLNVKEAYLFGSYSKGNAREHSDIDIALLFEGKKDVFDLQIELFKLRRPIDLRIEPHPIAVKDFNVNYPLYNEIIKHGVKIYQAS